MKSLIQLFAIILIFVIAISTTVAQGLSNLPVIAVLNIDSKGLTLEPSQLGNIARTELSKLNRFQVMDRYDVDYVIEKNEFAIDKCYGKICMVEAGKILKTDKMLTGSA
jgi:curli biogenesis system outer membrane secretion channel CsgG